MEELRVFILNAKSRIGILRLLVNVYKLLKILKPVVKERFNLVRKLLVRRMAQSLHY